MKSKLISILVILIFISSCIANTAFAVTQADYDRLQQQKEEAEREKNNIAQQKENEESELDKINVQLADLNNEIHSLQVQLDDLASSISNKEKEITEKEAELKEKEELLKKRLVSMYVHGKIEYIDALMGSSSYMEMLMVMDAIETIADADTKLINKITDEKKELEEIKAKLVEEKAQVDSVKAEKDAKNAELSAVQADKESKIASLNEEEKKKQVEIEQYNEAMVRVNQELQEAYRKAQQQANQGGNGLHFDGSFIWPCNNRYITSTVKPRWGRTHKGIDIAESYGSVYASASGYCYNAYDRYGYGTYIMIFHGSGYVTLYGHLNYSSVSDGQYVSQGQVIAQSGNSGGSTGPHLHFEIRQANSVTEFFSKGPLNPLDYLPGGYTLAPGASSAS